VLGEEDGAWKIEARPKRSSQYTRSTIRVKMDDYTVVHVESYDKDGLVRDIRYSDFTTVKGIRTARTAEVADRTRKSRTILKLDKIEYNIPLNKDAFTGAALRGEAGGVE